MAASPWNVTTRRDRSSLQFPDDDDPANLLEQWVAVNGSGLRQTTQAGTSFSPSGSAHSGETVVPSSV
jgi:hypothetical protein